MENIYGLLKRNLYLFIICITTTTLTWLKNVKNLYCHNVAPEEHVINIAVLEKGYKLNPMIEITRKRSNRRLLEQTDYSILLALKSLLLEHFVS